jgi:hypothetical protein
LPGNEFQPVADRGLLGGIGLALVKVTMARRQNITSDWALFFIVAALTTAGFLAVAAFSNHPARPGDDWRRTASGWQRTAAWPVAIENSSANPSSLVGGGRAGKIPRWDTHPAVLAFVQLVGVLAALRFFAAPAPLSFRDWLALLTQSFRASAFGS